MKSKANIKGHPLHPILVCFPIAFFTGAFVCDLITLISDRQFGQTPVFLLIAGIIGGLLAAIPGLIDFIFTVPPKSSGKKRAARHGITNVCVLLVFGAALYYRHWMQEQDILVIAGIEVAGMALLGYAGWMGGTLVYRNQIGVNPRYANAGKYREVYLNANGKQFEFDDFKEMEVNQMCLIHVDGRRIVVSKTEKGWAAFSDHCTHKGGSLAGGAMICSTVQCPWHGSQFDVNTGSVKAGPAKEKIEIYVVEEKDGKLIIRW